MADAEIHYPPKLKPLKFVDEHGDEFAIRGGYLTWLPAAGGRRNLLDLDALALFIQFLQESVEEGQ